jgi:hypothetical protein
MDKINVLEIVKEFGFSFVILLIIVFLCIKYIPKWFDILLDKANKRDDREELLKEVIRQNTAVVENNNIIVKEFMTSKDKLETKVDTLICGTERHDRRAEHMAQDLKVLVERK